MNKLFASAIILLLTVACEGPAGPMGPAGQEGPEGDPGPGTLVVRSAIVASDGSAAVALPAAAGSLSNPPALTCYLSETSAGPFLIIGTDLAGPVCGLVQNTGNLVAIIVEAPPGWLARFAAVY